MTPPIISLRHVTKSYATGAPGRGSANVALDAVELDIPRGDIFGIIGASGAGKSTLVRLINLLERPDSGAIRVNGRDSGTVTGGELLKLRREIGMVFQHFNLLSARTVAENVAFPLRLAGVRDKTQIAARVSELLGRVGLSDHASKYPRQLSGGQKQRVGIARALACRPPILLCDEATSALDPETTRSVLGLLRELNRELGLTVVLITHEMDVVRQICHRVAVLDHGRIAETGAVEDVFLHPRHPATRVLVREAFGETLVHDRLGASGHVVRLTFLGAATYSPILSHLAREQGVEFTLLGGKLGTIRDEPFAQLNVAFTGGDQRAALARLKAAGISVETLTEPAGGIPQQPLREFADVV
ncbi:methionine ABC transporter ATP-binding protein [Ancylobacter lacus]|uniref:methionine ABC transporter ATP-binding protein n=1 Tax=Ancylobacter lacus TaxID=2579970 RepID=UPI001BCFEE85|nr:ATP-binding cassette domain-containing protein [Ancylobacter lacus]MBS7537580.1 ATP-binding cassette domain-containing protein [Ancylobacter lacus]